MSPSIVVTVLCNQPEDFTSDLGSYQSRYLFDSRTLWRSVLSARVPECQKLKIVGYTSMAKCKALT